MNSENSTYLNNKSVLSSNDLIQMKQNERVHNHNEIDRLTFDYLYKTTILAKKRIPISNDISLE